MENLKTIEEAKAAGKEMAKRMLKAETDNAMDFTDLMKDISEAGVEDMESQTLASLLSLPIEQFNILAPVFLDELEKNYNLSNNQMLIVHALNVTGKTLEEVRAEYEALCDEIDENLIGYPVQKIDFLKRVMGLFYNTVSEMEGVEKHVVTIPIQFCDENAKLPSYAHLTDSGMDVYATKDITINPGETVLVPTGIKVAIPRGYELQVRPKSGRSLKSKLRISNAPGTIDAGYRDEIGIIVDNIAPVIKSADIDENGRLYNILWGESYTIEKGEKIAQLVLAKVPKVAWVTVKSLDSTEDRGGGFGSTGLK